MNKKKKKKQRRAPLLLFQFSRCLRDVMKSAMLYQDRLGINVVKKTPKRRRVWSSFFTHIEVLSARLVGSGRIPSAASLLSSASRARLGRRCAETTSPLCDAVLIWYYSKPRIFAKTGSGQTCGKFQNDLILLVCAVVGPLWATKGFGFFGAENAIYIYIYIYTIILPRQARDKHRES